MSVVEHRQAVMAAERTVRGLRVLFGRLGTAEHPRGAILTAYRNGRRAMRDVMRRQSPQMAVEAAEVLAGLRESVGQVAMGMLVQASDLGTEQARAELGAYGLDFARQQVVSELQGAHEAFMGPVDAQVRAARAATLMGWDEGMVIGDDERTGVLNPAPVVREGARWLAIAAMLAWMKHVEPAERGQRVNFRRQAVAAIDERTTDCCLRVHGQVVDLKEDFRLTGTPRYANKMRDPPFHWYCRTSVALVRAEDADDALSRAMRNAARLEIEAREEAEQKIEEIKSQLAELGAAPDVRKRKEDTDEIKRLRDQLRMWRARARVEIHPATATSRR